MYRDMDKKDTNNKRGKIRLNLKDRKILYRLDINSRQSNSEIAKKVGLSKDVVGYRIKKLEESGLIKGYYTLIDFSRLGYFSIRVYLKFYDASPEKEKEIIDFLIKNKKVFYVAMIEGSYDINIGTLIKDIYEFEDFWLIFKRRFKQYIGEEKISIFTKAYHFHRAYILNKKIDDSEIEFFGQEKIVKYDKTDLEILKIISKNARIRLIEISEKLKIPPTTIAHRIKQLEKNGVIQAYRFIFDFQKFGYEYYKVDLILKDISKLEEFVSFAHRNPNIIYVDKTIGGSDFEFDLEVKNKEEFLSIIENLRKLFTEIRTWNFFSMGRYQKLLYFPDS